MFWSLQRHFLYRACPAYISYFLGGKKNATICFQTLTDLNMLSGVQTNSLSHMLLQSQEPSNSNTAEFWCTLSFKDLYYESQPSPMCPSLRPAYFNVQFRIKYIAVFG